MCPGSGRVRFFFYNMEDLAKTFFALFPLFSATWALTTRLRCSTSGIVPLTLWTDPFSSLMPSVFPPGYTTCPCPKRPQPCLRWSPACRRNYREGGCKVWEDVTISPDSVVGAELQRAHHYSPARVPLHLLSPLPARPTLHSHWQQHPAHHKCVKVSPSCQGVHGLPGGTRCFSL